MSAFNFYIFVMSFYTGRVLYYMFIDRDAYVAADVTCNMIVITILFAVMILVTWWWNRRRG